MSEDGSFYFCKNCDRQTHGSHMWFGESVLRMWSCICCGTLYMFANLPKTRDDYLQRCKYFLREDGDGPKV